MTHFSELAVDKLLAGELSGDAAAALRGHAGACARCAATLDDALATRAEFALPALQVAPRRAVQAPRWRSLAIAAPVALAAAVALVVAWPRAHGEGERVAGTRTKGSAIVGCFVAHGDAVRRGALRETVEAGDRIELVTTTTEPVWFAAVSDDAAGVRSVYAAPRLLAAGHDQLAPDAIELDATLGAETVTGIFCAARFEPRAIDLAAPPAGCTVDHFELVKVAR